MKFSLEKRIDSKNKMVHHTPCKAIRPVDGLCYKRG